MFFEILNKVFAWAFLGGMSLAVLLWLPLSLRREMKRREKSEWNVAPSDPLWIYSTGGNVIPRMKSDPSLQGGDCPTCGRKFERAC